ncbi:oxidoreductase [Leifsonia sp. H3M29-4]|uniref:FAD-dependent oxidoreductase n=1 Tax=Salinibacterium metalliresistens TaxID=3031321 RepID=UPI0023D9E723|nr:oxidoreductase [Salinibacterium metalliresistens]MDF1478294.1 oxidoreductase [Salinibacterium metalliresistens]
MKRWLDRTTGAVPMYKLVVMSLVLIELAAIVFAALGLVPRDPLAIAVSSVVAVAASLAGTWAASLVARVKLHLESSIITGLLVFFVLEPKLELVALAGVALAAALAGVSKFLVAVRGRHVFNPAALGAFVVGLVGLSYPAWWAGTPALLPFVAVTGFLVLYRTQRLGVGLFFLALTSVVFGLRIAIAGGTVGDWLGLALLSSPAVFLAVFMLSEPLTLPPRRWQQLVVATVVALLFTIPFNIGPLYSSPLLALLVGNLLAFFFGQRRAIRMTYLGKTQLSPTTWELSFQPSRAVRFVPGQYMELTIPHRRADFRGSRRYFSISSAPSATAPITFAITVPSKSSSFKQALLDLEPGAIVHGTGVGGDFALPVKVSEPLLLVAGGIGITPFASQLAHATERGEHRNVVVVYATSAAGEPPYASLLEQSGARVVLYSPEPPDPLPTGWTYGGAGRVTGERLAADVPDAAGRRTFISGPPALVSELRHALRGQGARRVHTDAFSGY